MDVSYLSVALFVPLVAILGILLMVIVSMYLMRRTRGPRDERATRGTVKQNEIK